MAAPPSYFGSEFSSSLEASGRERSYPPHRAGVCRGVAGARVAALVAAALAFVLPVPGPRSVPAVGRPARHRRRLGRDLRHLRRADRRDRGLLARPRPAGEDRREASSPAAGRDQRRCACCRSCSAACCGRSRGCGRTRARSATGWRTAPTSTRTTSPRWATRRRPASSSRDEIAHLRNELDAMAAKGTLPPELAAAAGRARRRADAGRRRAARVPPDRRGRPRWKPSSSGSMRSSSG